MSPNKHKLFVARKVLKILRFVNTNGASVYHIPGVNNPADKFSRPANPSTFVASNPWTFDHSCYPPEPAPITIVCAIDPQDGLSDSSSTLLDVFNRYSSLDRMIGLVVRMRSWITRIRPESDSYQKVYWWILTK